ncbi:MAG: CocE/NonD family hydrolase [Candidatus Dormibacterales bacterium]
MATAPAGMLIERDVPIPMRDGLVLRADVFRPERAEGAPVILTMGPYGKGLPYQEAHYAPMWKWLLGSHPEVLEGSSGSFMTWETVDPERWVPAGYACVRVDSRGAGRSPGVLEIWSPQETDDLYECIEWAGAQPWSTGRVGLCGISYYAMNQWWVAGMQPPHLAAMIAWEGANDYYREISHHGGILSNVFFGKSWYERQVLSMQHGRPGPVDPWLGDCVNGPEVLSETELAANRVDTPSQNRRHAVDDEWHRSRSANLKGIRVPFLSAANWAGFGLHERGNFEAFTEAASEQKWLEVHPGRHEEWFYLPYGVALQMRFMDHFLKGEDNGWDREPRVWLQIRYADGNFELRKEDGWPLARTRWTPLYLDAGARRLSWTPVGPGRTSFDALGEPAVFLSDPVEYETELTGPMALSLGVSSSTADADLFVTFQAFDPEGREVEFQGTVDPHTPLAQGWLRVSHRELDPLRSVPWRPFHPHRRRELLEPGRVYEVEVEIWPTCVVLPVGSRLALVVGGRDFERPGADDSQSVFPSKGSGPFLHDDPQDRPADVFGGVTTIHSGGEHPARLLLPIIAR